MSADPRSAAAGVTAYSAAGLRTLILQATQALASPGAPLHCGSDCLGYHRGWVLLQHLGLISGLASERAFIVAALREQQARRPIRSLLIAGCADFGLLSVVHEALGNAIGRVAVTVSDRCTTPLALCTRYAVEMGFEVACERHDLLSAPPAGRFDLVLMHSLLSFCPPQDRGRLLAGLAGRLAAGGTLLAYQSIRPAAEPATLAYGDAEVASLVERARRESGDAIDVAQLPADRVAELIRAFCSAKTTVSVPSVASVVGAAEAHGLVLRGCRLLFDSESSSHRAATPASHHLKYEFAFGSA